MVWWSGLFDVTHASETPEREEPPQVFAPGGGSFRLPLMLLRSTLADDGKASGFDPVRIPSRIG